MPNGVAAVLQRVAKRFDALPLYLKFVLAFSFTVTVVVWTSVTNIVDLARTEQALDRFNEDIGLVVGAGQLVGALQEERNDSVLLLAKDPAATPPSLEVSRRNTDAALNRLNHKLERRASSGTESIAYSNIRSALRSLSQLPNIRDKVRSEAIDSDTLGAFFNQAISALNQQLSRVSRETSEPALARQLNAYFILNRLRELLGQERLLLHSVLQGGSLTDQDRRQLIYLVGRQHSLLVGLQSQTYFADALNLSANSSTLRRYLLDVENLDAPIDPGYWQTWERHQQAFVKQLEDIEQQLIRALTEKAQSRYQQAYSELWRYIALSPLALVASFLFAWLIIRYVKRRMMLSDKVFNHTHDRITVSDADGNIVDVNPSFTQMTGYQKEEVVGKNPRFLQSGRQSKAFYQAMWRDIMETGYWQGELWNRRKDGELYAELSTISVIRDERGSIQSFIAISSDITERAAEHKRELEYQAYHDALTGLPNIMLVRDRLEHALSLASRDNETVVVAAFDIDNFKAVNNLHGHVVGDRAIELIAQRLNDLLRSGDTLGRVTGDEFIFVIEGSQHRRSVEQLLERLRQRASEDLSIDGRTLKITASIGATLYPDDQHDADTLIRHAVQALHMAKQGGRNQVCWFDAEHERQQNHLTQLIAALREAMTEQSLVLYYQPKVNMRDGQVVGAEALLRWQRADGSLIPPGDFLPHIEHHSFSITLGDYVIDQALQQLADWQQQGIHLPISINVSAVQLLDDRFVESLAQHLSRYPDISPAQVELEILESAAIGKIKEAARVIERCKALGVSVSLDDFGTGYAALDYLKQLPAQTLKIDQSFVRDMRSGDGNMAIIKGVIGLAEAFEFNVIAEGVETAEQGKMLVQLGCPIGQGFGIAKPMPAEALKQWLADWSLPDSWRG